MGGEKYFCSFDKTTKGGYKMAEVRHNEDVKNEQDLQNLVIGILFRQEEPYKDKAIVEAVNYWLKGSKFYNNLELIEQKVEENLDLLERIDKVAFCYGICYPKNPLTGHFPPEYYKAKGLLS